MVIGLIPKIWNRFQILFNNIFFKILIILPREQQWLFQLAIKLMTFM